MSSRIEKMEANVAKQAEKLRMAKMRLDPYGSALLKAHAAAKIAYEESTTDVHADAIEVAVDTFIKLIACRKPTT